MNELCQQMPQWLSEAYAKRAKHAFRWFLGHLKTGLFDGTEGVCHVINHDTKGLLRLFIDNPQICKVIEQAASVMKFATQHGYHPADMRLAQTIAAMFDGLVLIAQKGNAPQATLDAFAAAHKGALRQALSLAHDQVDDLCRFIIRIHSFFRELASDNARFVLIEMPSGNPLPVKMLSRLLRQFATVQEVRIALSRIDPKPVGITLGELFAEQLQTANIRPNDIVIYIDEWKSGSNLHKICKFLRKSVPPEAFLFPAAILSDKAKSERRYNSLCKAHDKLWKVWGRTTGEEFRWPLKSLPSTLIDEPFFWSEHDRTAGYRKMQLHGSMFSLVDTAVKQLYDEIRKSADEAGIGEAHARSFEDSYRDYQACREELERCANDHARGGAIDDFDTAMEQIRHRCIEILGNRPAERVVKMAFAYSWCSGPLASANRYHFKDHAPVLFELKGAAAATHRIVMEVLNEWTDKLMGQGLVH